jgi:hypothetical protein
MTWEEKVVELNVIPVLRKASLVSPETRSQLTAVSKHENPDEMALKTMRRRRFLFMTGKG